MLVASTQQPIPLGIGNDTVPARDPLLAFVLATLVSVAVFALLWKIRKTFGMRE
ncbi:MAG: hypothetical protein ACT4TC_05455 [Myxococcaceae bacterium]